ncbi:DUF4097 family beta strand repeat-containing protein [Alkalicoccobacillus plakortidis]|uniref:DUF4097 domain-containing protein n=1 Tax=Alkalicoccobacillus plakortidis TaxID=444060 RepID=A0ABT0XKB6_9BACI|nr:DUF4097 domain-containing protein [Alkalicoccobacillus plakortidis]MCM2675657.1 DUF4097 domain-containing protein [Alkalicoccobacillus plakortidis]
MEEKKMILKMIEDGKVTAEEGIKLLQAIEKDESTSSSTQLSTEVNWEKGNESRDQKAKSDAGTYATKFTDFVETAFKKIKDADFDFNFGSHVVVDHTFHHRNETPSVIDVSLENGSITLVPWEESDIRVECQAHVYRVKDSEEARRIFLQETAFSFEDSKLQFRSKIKSLKIKTTIYVPKADYDRVKLYSFNGEISAADLKVDTLEVNTLNGALSFEGVQAKKANVETVNGSIHLKESNIHLVDAKTLNGAVYVSGKVQDADIEAINGTLTYELNSLDEAGFAELKTTTGTIHVKVAPSIRLEGKFKTNVGSFSNDMADYEVLEEKKDFANRLLHFVGNSSSTPRVKVSAVSNTGSIKAKDLV